MTAHASRPRVKISACVERPILDLVVEVQAAERRSRSAAVELLVLEALSARGATPERIQGASGRPLRGGEADPADREALSGFPGAPAVRR